MRDEAPEELAKRISLAAGALHEMRLFGFGQVATPVLEKRELFVRSLGEDSDAVSKELYTLDNDQIALRPENTAGAVRMLVEGAHGVYRGCLSLVHDLFYQIYHFPSAGATTRTCSVEKGLKKDVGDSFDRLAQSYLAEPAWSSEWRPMWS